VSSAASVRAAPLTLARAVPVWAWLGGLVALSTVVRYGFARRMVAPWIMVDELIYSELAKSFAGAGELALRGVPAGNAYGIVYPILISPAWALFEAVPDAYDAAKAINSLVISLAAVPAYLIARRVVTQASALAVAALTLLLPSMLYAGTLMTENAFLPVFLTAALLLVLALEQPSPGRVVALLAVSGVAFLTRAQAVALLPAILTAPLLAGRRLRDYRGLYGLTAAAVVLALAAQWARGSGPLELLGAYREAEERSYDVGAVAKWLLYHVAELDLALWFLPFAAFLALAVSRRSPFLAATASLSVWLLLQVAAFASQHSLRIEERNVLYLFPLFLVALALWLERPPPLRASVVAAGLAAALPVVIPYDDLIGVSATSDTFGLLAWWEVHTWGIPLDLVWLAVGLAGIGVVALLWTSRLVALAAVGLLFALSSWAVEVRIREASIGSLFQGITNPQRDWIDRAVDGEVAALYTGRSDYQIVFQNEFFSRSVGRVYHMGTPVPSGLAQHSAPLDRDTGSLGLSAPYVFTDQTVPLAGRVVARDTTKGTLVVATGGPVRVVYDVEGVYEDGWSRPVFTYRRYRCDGGSVVLSLARDPGLFVGRQRVGSYVFPPGRVEARIRVPLGPDCTARLRVSPTTVPGAGDERALGVRVDGVRYQP
jgi:hypothetical protein